MTGVSGYGAPDCCEWLPGAGFEDVRDGGDGGLQLLIVRVEVRRQTHARPRPVITEDVPLFQGLRYFITMRHIQRHGPAAPAWVAAGSTRKPAGLRQR